LNGSSSNAVAKKAVVGGLNGDTGHTNNTWTSLTLTHGTLKYNSDIRMCILDFNINYKFTSTSSVTSESSAIPSSYVPPFTIMGAFTNPNFTGMVDTSGNVLGMLNQTTSSNAQVYFTCIWSY